MSRVGAGDGREAAAAAVPGPDGARRRSRIAVLSAALALAAACDGTGPATGPRLNLSVSPELPAPAEAGKQSPQILVATLSDATGDPIPDHDYSWTTDPHSGWVHPASGRTNHAGRIVARWVAGWPGEGVLSLNVADSVSQTTKAIPVRSTESRNPPAGALAIWMNNADPSRGYSVDLTPLSEPPGTYYAAMNWDGGYAGLQRAGSRYDRQLQFSVWDVPGVGGAQVVKAGEGVLCTPFGGEGTGRKCELEYPWSVGTAYRFEVTEADMDGGSAMTLHVTDLAAGERRFVGTLRYARRARMTSFAMFVEDFWMADRHCLAREVRSAAIRRAMALIDGSWQPLTEGRLAPHTEDSQNPGTPPCANLAARDHAAGIEIVIGGETASDPNGPLQFTIPN